MAAKRKPARPPIQFKDRRGRWMRKNRRTGAVKFATAPSGPYEGRSGRLRIAGKSGFASEADVKRWYVNARRRELAAKKRAVKLRAAKTEATRKRKRAAEAKRARARGRPSVGIRRMGEHLYLETGVKFERYKPHRFALENYWRSLTIFEAPRLMPGVSSVGYHDLQIAVAAMATDKTMGRAFKDSRDVMLAVSVFDPELDRYGKQIGLVGEDDGHTLAHAAAWSYGINQAASELLRLAAEYKQSWIRAFLFWHR